MQISLIRKFFTKLRKKTEEGRLCRLNEFHYKLIDDKSNFIDEKFTKNLD